MTTPSRSARTWFTAPIRPTRPRARSGCSSASCSAALSPPLILASRSPQRRAILEQVGIEFSVRVPDVAELTAGEPETVTSENARRKAAAIAAADGLATGTRVLGVDTEVWCQGQIYGKPADQAAARSMLASLSGRTHEVVSGLCLAVAGAPEPPRTAIARTGVTFRELGDALLDWYIATGEWRERAGGYAIQGRGAALVAGIEGDYLNVVGLPLAALLEIVPDILPVL